jgi:hypothetical protein
MILNLALGYVIRNTLENYEGLKLNGTYQKLLRADNVNLEG